jgi:hypothetical protein
MTRGDMSLTAAHLRALEASAEAAAMSAQALVAEIQSLRAALKHQLEEDPGVDLPKVCPKCGSKPEFHIPTSDGRTACRSCGTIF